MLEETLEKCELCPRKCRVDRLHGQTGFCGVSGKGIYVSRAALHFWEEPCISGKNGSGTVFFSGCTLRCCYCQNYAISGAEAGKEISVERLSEIFLELQDKKAENINLVTPTHYAQQIREALLLSRAQGLTIPVVYNTSGYETVEALREMADVTDIYLTDHKYADPELAAAFSRAKDYPEVADRAIEEMVRLQPDCVFDDRGMMKKGVIVRHLLLPGHVKNAKAVISDLYQKYGDHIYLSIMSQYTPVREHEKYPELNRKVTEREYNRLLDFVIGLGIENAFMQEGGTASESFIPAFDGEGV